MGEQSFIGGARIGWVSASWPFARLKTSAERLTISSLGTYEFRPSQVVSVEPYGSIPLLASGIRINHNRTEYPKNIVFWCMGNRGKVLAALKQSGFSPSGLPTQRVSGFPIRWSVVIAVVALWNALFWLDNSAHPQSREPGMFALLALLTLFALATATRASFRIQQWVLREGHHVGEINGFLVLLQLVTGIVSLAFGVTWITHAHAG